MPAHLPSDLTGAIQTPIHDSPRPRRACLAPESPLHIPAGDPVRPTILRHRDAAERRDALVVHAADLAVKLRGDDGAARLHSAKNIVTAIALDASPITPDAARVGDATTAVHRALLDRLVEPSSAAHFATVAIDALVAGGFIR